MRLGFLVMSIFILVVLGSRISSSHFHLFSLSRLCVLYVETLTGVLFWSFDLLGNFRAACFPFETSSGSLLAILAQGVAAMSEAAAMG